MILLGVNCGIERKEKYGNNSSKKYAGACKSEYNAVKKYGE